MPWLDFFATLSDTSVFKSEKLLKTATGAENMFAYNEYRQTRDYSIIISSSVFPFSGADTAADDWKARVDLIAEASIRLKSLRSDAIIRIYLDPRMQDFRTILWDAGCEIFQMHLESDGPNPGILWKYLAIEESTGIVTTVTDVYFDNIAVNLDCIDMMLTSSAQSWRMPIDRSRNYRPVDPNRFGTTLNLPISKLLRSYLHYFHIERQLYDARSYPNKCFDQFESKATVSPASRNQPDWSAADFESHFLLSAVYPRIALSSLITLVESVDLHSRWLSLDIEYVTSLNGSSSLFFVDSFSFGKGGDRFLTERQSEIIFENLSSHNHYLPGNILAD